MKRKSLLAGAIALVLSIASPSTTAFQTQAPLISDSVKFPKEDAALVEGVSRINRLVNRSMVYVTDQEHYGTAEKWVMMPSDGKGDCEDYALSKMELLRRAKVPVIIVARVRSVQVKDDEMEGGHAILELLLPNGSIAILDNRFNDLMLRSELEAKGYKFFDW